MGAIEKFGLCINCSDTDVNPFTKIKYQILRNSLRNYMGNNYIYKKRNKGRSIHCYIGLRIYLFFLTMLLKFLRQRAKTHYKAVVLVSHDGVSIIFPILLALIKYWISFIVFMKNVYF